MRNSRQRHFPSLPAIVQALVLVAFHCLDPAPARADSNQKRAEALHAQAAQAAMQGNYVRASALWKRAYALHNEPKYLYNLGRIGVEMDRPVMALEHFERFVARAAGNPVYSKGVARARRHIVSLRRRVATLEVVVPQRGARVFVDERSLGAGPVNTAMRLTPGDHLVSVSLPGHHAETRTVNLPAGTRRRVEIRLKPIKPRVKVVTRTKVVAKKTRLVYPLPRWLPWTIMGVGVVTGVLSAWPMVRAQQLFDDYDYRVSIDPTGDHSKLEKRAERYRNLGVGLIVTGGVIAAGGLLAVLLNRPKQVEEKPKAGHPAAAAPTLLLPVPSPGGFGLALAGAF